MIEHVWRRAILALGNDGVIVATDSDEIALHMKSVGAHVFISKSQHNNGTSRVSEYFQNSSFDFVVILQGDEVLIRPEIIRDIFDKMAQSEEDFINTISPINKINDLFENSIVKCWVDSTNNVRFIFRGNPLQYPAKGYSDLRIINGLFAISKKVLLSTKKESVRLSQSESIEQLAVLDCGINIKANEVEIYFPSVNTQQELLQAVELLQNNPIQISIQNRINAKI